MKRYVKSAAFRSEYYDEPEEIEEYDEKLFANVSQCSFDFDLGNNYDGRYLENRISEIMWDEFECDVTAVDFRSVIYPGKKRYSQCGFDFQWNGDTYDSRGIEDALAELIDEMGGNFFGIDFYSLTD